jgi:hypothetical protein
MDEKTYNELFTAADYLRTRLAYAAGLFEAEDVAEWMDGEDPEDWAKREAVYMSDFLGDSVLDIEVASGIDGEYRGCCAWVTLGGPTVWVDTARGLACASWGSDKVELSVAADAVAALDDEVRETWELARAAR